MLTTKIPTNCLHCGTKIPEERKKWKNVKYCSKVCKQRAVVYRYHKKNRNNSEYKLKRNLLAKKIRQQRTEKGLCSRCGAEKIFETTIDCSDCYVNRKSRMR